MVLSYHLNRRQFLKCAVFGVSGVSLNGLNYARKKTKRPNILLILIDDLGWMDLGCQGSRFYETPNIDKLAQQGMRFTNFYSACTVCSPTRASILTGKYPARLKITQHIPVWSGQLRFPEKAKYKPAFMHMHLPREETTLAERLSGIGYHSCHIGKWHLGDEPYYPEKQGFDKNVAGCHWGQPPSYFYPYKREGKAPTGYKLEIPTLTGGEPGEYLTDRLTNEAITYLQERAANDQPFYLNLWYYTVHTPIQAKEELLAKYQKKAQQWGDKAQGRPAYAAMIENLDSNVGKVLDALKSLDMDKDTLVIFTSDNGGLAAVTDNSPLRSGKGSEFEGGIRVPLIVRYPDKIPADSVTDMIAISCDFLPTLAEMVGMPFSSSEHIDGVSLWNVLRQTGDAPKRPLFFHFPHFRGNVKVWPHGIMREGDWKLIEYYTLDKKLLFNLKDDIGETKDRSTAFPDVVQRMSQKLYEHLKAVDAEMPKKI